MQVDKAWKHRFHLCHPQEPKWELAARQDFGHCCWWRRTERASLQIAGKVNEWLQGSVRVGILNKWCVSIPQVYQWKESSLDSMDMDEVQGLNSQQVEFRSLAKHEVSKNKAFKSATPLTVLQNLDSSIRFPSSRDGIQEQSGFKMQLDCWLDGLRSVETPLLTWAPAFIHLRLRHLKGPIKVRCLSICADPPINKATTSNMKTSPWHFCRESRFTWNHHWRAWKTQEPGPCSVTGTHERRAEQCSGLDDRR